MTMVCFSGHINEVKFIIKDYTSWYFRMWPFVALNIGMRGPLMSFLNRKRVGASPGQKRLASMTR